MRDHSKYKTLHVPKPIHAKLKQRAKKRGITMIEQIDDFTEGRDKVEVESRV
jgi:hypothetical protein